MSGFEEPALDSNGLFDSYETPNQIHTAHELALEQQEYLRQAHVNTVDMTKLVKDTISELDATCDHVGMPVRVMGRLILTTIDPRGVDFEAKKIDGNAVNRTSLQVSDPITVISMGYYADDHWPITISHLAKSSPDSEPEKVENLVFGSVYRDKRYHIPLDGSAYVESALKPTTPRIDLLEKNIPELFAIVSNALTGAENVSEALQGLSAIKLSEYPMLQLDDEIRYHLALYISKGLKVGENIPYVFSGLNKIHIPSGPKQYNTFQISEDAQVSGNITGIAINTSSFDKVGIVAKMPFDDNVKRTVIIDTTNTMHVTKQPILQVIRDGKNSA